MSVLLKLSLPIVVFLTGASIMILEIIGSRLLAPYMGTSIYVWTSLIGVILASLSLGYWLGGIWADRQASFEFLVFLLLSAALFITIMSEFQNDLLYWIYQEIDDLRLSSTLASLALFFVPSSLLGAILPLTLKLQLTSLEEVGKTLGSLYAWSTLGSIAGTFLTGYVLIAFLGHRRILLCVAGLLLLAACWVCLHLQSRQRVLILLCIVISFLLLSQLPVRSLPFTDLDTRYHRVWIYPTRDWKTGQTIQMMRLNDELSSAQFQNKQEYVWEYFKFFEAIHVIKPKLSKVLMLGAGAYQYPAYLSQHYPTVQMDIVELDEQLLDLSQQYFGFSLPEHYQVFQQDARVFLEQIPHTKYQLIIHDAMRSSVPPFQLLSREFFQLSSEHLTADGVLVMNLIGALEGEQSQLARAIAATCRQVFGEVVLFQVNPKFDLHEQQNLSLLAFKKKSPLLKQHPFLNHRYSGNWNSALILTDDYAPTEFLNRSFTNHWQKSQLAYLFDYIKLLKNSNDK